MKRIIKTVTGAPFLNAEALAMVAEVSPETVRRHMETARLFSVPVIGARGPKYLVCHDEALRYAVEQGVPADKALDHLDILTPKDWAL